MDNTNVTRTTGRWCAIGATTLTLGTIATALIPTSVPNTAMSYPYTPTTYAITMIIWAACHTLIFLGTLGLARSGAVGTSRIGQVGLWIALAGMAVIPPGTAAFALIASGQADSPAANTLRSILGFASLVAGIGFVLGGIAILRAGRWQGWHRFAPLLCGLYVFVALTPVLAALPSQVLWGLAGWSACFILLGSALYGQRSAPQRASLSAAPA